MMLGLTRDGGGGGKGCLHNARFDGGKGWEQRLMPWGVTRASWGGGGRGQWTMQGLGLGDGGRARYNGKVV